MEVLAHAKLNLSLDVLNRRPDGYHEMRMVMQTISLADTLTLTPGGEGVRVRTSLSYLPTDARNLAAAAARAFWVGTGRPEQGLEIAIEKVIPVCAGMAGGSADAAAVLRALNEAAGTGLSRQALARLGEQVGSDVPYCVLEGTALAEGRGEVLTPLPPLPFCHIVVCKPSFSVSTPELFGRLDCRRIRRRPDTEGLVAALAAGDLEEVARRVYNVFEDVLPERRAGVIAEIKGELLNHGALGAAMSGTGPTVFGLFREQEQARQACRALSESFRDVWTAVPVGRE